MGRRSIYGLIVLLGLVSMLGDIVYEGSRSILPQYLSTYIDDPTFIGIVLGIGEFISFGLRLPAGLVADRYGIHLQLYLLGYLLIGSIPLLGLTLTLPIIITLIYVERLGKSLRGPTRDTLISLIAGEVGRGKAFGLHEALDQVGATMGPLAISIIILYTGDFSTSFITLSIPFILLVMALIYIRNRIGSIAMHGGIDRGRGRASRPPDGYRNRFILYIAALTLNMMGLIHWSIIIYLAEEAASIFIASLLYLLIQVVDALVSLPAGYLYDRYGSGTLYISFIIAAVASIASLNGGIGLLILSGMIYGAILGLHESIYRAYTSEITPIYYRGTAYGIQYMMHGLGLAVSGAIFGYLVSIGDIISGYIYVAATQSIGLILLRRVLR